MCEISEPLTGDTLFAKKSITLLGIDGPLTTTYCVLVVDDTCTLAVDSPVLQACAVADEGAFS